MSVLVTGASGFIGRRLCASLETSGHRALRVVRNNTQRDEVGVGNIDGATDWKLALSQRPDVVVHLAAQVHTMRQSNEGLEQYHRINIDGTLHLARQCAAKCVKRFIFLSSIKVLGEGRATPYRADDPASPKDAYAISKWEAEQGLWAIARDTGMEIVVIRPPLVYGPGVKGNFASLVHWIQRGVPLPLGAVHNRRSLIALENLVDFIALCVDPKKSPSAANRTFLISDDETVSTTELLHRIARAYGRKTRFIPVPASWLQRAARLVGKEALADRLLGSLIVDSSKARELLGWQPVVTMDQQLWIMASHAART